MDTITPGFMDCLIAVRMEDGNFTMMKPSAKAIIVFIG
jgi:hypothetical protein